MRTRIIAILMAATLAAVPPAFAQGSINTNPRRTFGNFGPTSDAIARTNPGNQAREQRTDPNQFRSLPGFVAPAQSRPNTRLLPNSDDRIKGLDDDCWRMGRDLIPQPLEPPSKRRQSTPSLGPDRKAAFAEAENPCAEAMNWRTMKCKAQPI